MKRKKIMHWRSCDATYFVTFRKAVGIGDFSDEERDIIRGAIKFFHKTRYELLAYVVMNDHVHALVIPADDFPLEKLIHTWKSFSANQIQRCCRRKGAIWLSNYIDRIVQEDQEIDRVAHYILSNPWKRWPDLLEYEFVGIKECFYCAVECRSGLHLPKADLL